MGGTAKWTTEGENNQEAWITVHRNNQCEQWRNYTQKKLKETQKPIYS